MQRRFKGLAPSVRKAEKLKMKNSKGKKEEDHDNIRNDLLIMNPPPRPAPEWTKDQEEKAKVMKNRRDFYKSWARYQMWTTITETHKKRKVHFLIDDAVEELKKVDPILHKSAKEPHEEAWSKEFIAGYLPDTPPINGYNPVTRQIDHKLVKPKPTYE